MLTNIMCVEPGEHWVPAPSVINLGPGGKTPHLKTSKEAGVEGHPACAGGSVPYAASCG